MSPWQAILPHFDWLAGQRDLDGFFDGLRAFVASACDARTLADRFVFPSTINMSVFRTRGPVGYAEPVMPARFVVSPSGPMEVRLRYYPAGAPEPTRSWVVSPAEAVAIIATEFGA